MSGVRRKPPNDNCSRVSWPNPKGDRLFGRLIKWDGEYAVTQYMGMRCRIHKSNLTYEVG